VGCLGGPRGEFQLTDEEGNVYVLIGHTSDLDKLSGAEISVQGTKDESTQPLPTFNIISFKKVFRAPDAKLSFAFSDPSKWDPHTNLEFGITFALPRFHSSTDVSSSDEQANFAADQGSMSLAHLEIPMEIYPNTNFAGGSFAIFANPEITNPQSCAQFGSSDPRFLSSRTIAGISYTEMTSVDAAMGSAYGEYYFHTFQNNVCFELSLRLGASNTSSQPLGCRVSTVGENDNLKVIDTLLGRVSFVRPTIEAAAVKQNPAPKVTSFTASSDIADHAVNRGVLTFSWSTEGADYVEFSYRCPDAATRVVILEGNARDCENSPQPAMQNTERFNHSPNSSTDVSFGNFHRDDPIPIVVTITPSSHGKDYPNASQSLTISIAPYNPFPKGVPSETRNMTILYPARADGTSKYAQGSQLKIDWTDSLSRDPCVDLYLVQDTGSGAAAYRSQIVRHCLTPAAGGSFTWTIPNKYSGFGFRIYAAAPGGISSAVGAPFSIVGSAPSLP
jgi:hypothetical protein